MYFESYQFYGPYICVPLASIAHTRRGMHRISPVRLGNRILPLEIAELPLTIWPVDPKPYLEFNYMVRHEKAVIIDLRSITQETAVIGASCVTLCDIEEPLEEVTIAINDLIGGKSANLVVNQDGSQLGRGL